MPRSTLSPISPLAFTLFCVLFLLGFSSCGVGDFVGAYFNTYYNAQKAFSEAEDEVWKQPELKQDGAARNYLAQFNVPQGAKTKFASVIEKCSKLLEYHPDSKLVDDALMMIGKSYFYQSDYQRAERKFKELETGYPESDLLPEAKMLMAYSFYKEGDRASAAAAAAELLDAARKDENERIIAYTALLVAQMDLEDKNYTLALEHFSEAAENAETPEQRTMTLLKVGEMYAKIEDFVNAEDAYRRAVSQAPDYLGEFRGSIGVARMLVKQAKYDDALDLLQDLRDDKNNKEFFGEIELEMANLYRDKGDMGAAIEQYRYVDTAYARSEWAANSYYQLGLLYETRLALYDSARVAYNKGRAEAGQSTVAPLLTRRADYMNKYATFSSEIQRMDSLRIFWLTPRDTTQQDSSLARADSVGADTTSGKGIAAADSGKPKAPAPPPLPLDSVLTRLAGAQSELATLFYTGIERTDSALYWYERLVEQHPESRRVPRAIFSIAQIYSQDSTIARPAVDSLYWKLVRQYPESEFAAEARRLLGLPAVTVSPDSAEVLYKRAESALLAGRNASALDTLLMVEQMFPASKYAPRAQYAAGWLYEEVLNQPDSAIANYQRLRAQYPASPYAARVQPKLLEVEMKAKADAADSAATVRRKADSTTTPAGGVPAVEVPPGALPAGLDSAEAAAKGRTPGAAKRRDIDDELSPLQRRALQARQLRDSTSISDSTDLHSLPGMPDSLQVPDDLPPGVDSTGAQDVPAPPGPPDSTSQQDSLPTPNQERQTEE